MKHFLLYFNTLLKCIPDFVILAKPPAIDRSRSQIQCHIHFTGTKISSDNDHLLKPQGCKLADSPLAITFSNSLGEAQRSALERVESVYNSSGNLYLLYGKGEWLINYDNDSLDVTKFEMKYTLTSFKKHSI